MIGRHKTYRVELTQAESKQLQQIVAARKSCQSEAKRAKIILTHWRASSFFNSGGVLGCVCG